MPTNIPKRLSKYVPLLDTLCTYSTQTFNSDIVAGIITAILLIPQGMAYALLAGLPVEVGIYSSLLPALFYVVFGTSRVLSVGPVSIAAIMVASVLASPEVTALGSPVQNAMILALQGGAILCLMSIFQMGNLVHFISQPVLSGFTSGAAIIILCSQLPNMLGIHLGACDNVFSCAKQSYQGVNSAEMFLGLLAIVIILTMGKPLLSLMSRSGVNERLSTGISKSAPLISVLIGTAMVSYFALDIEHGVAIVGGIPDGLPSVTFNFGNVTLDHFLTLLPSAFFISLIAYVESVAIAKVMASIRNEKINPNQELVALGSANIASSVTGGMPVAGGFSRTMVNFSAGAQSQIAMLIAVVILAIVLVSVNDVLEAIPKAVLASIIIIAVLPLIGLKKIVSVWKQDKSDGYSQLVTLLGVLLLGIEEGIMLGVVATVLSYLKKAGKPHIAVVGRIKDTEQFRNIKRHQVETWEDLLLIRIDENITFANINFISDFIEREAQNSQAKNIVLIFSSVSHIDTTAISYFRQLIGSFKGEGVSIHLAEVKGPVIDKLEKSDFIKELLPGKIFFQTSDAVKCFVGSTEQ
jgi:SulP family sulfate permease